tara:strand:+ start:915 stop:1256 length:342 start_codon:yes stop_codon:yes gene_type:complete
MPRPKHQPTKETRELAAEWSGYGIPQEGIARKIGINADTLRKYYAEELAGGIAQANQAVAGSLFRMATAGSGKGQVAAAIFWAKTRMGWKETNIHEHAGSDGKPIQIEMVKLD